MNAGKKTKIDTASGRSFYLIGRVRHHLLFYLFLFLKNEFRWRSLCFYYWLFLLVQYFTSVVNIWRHFSPVRVIRSSPIIYVNILIDLRLEEGKEEEGIWSAVITATSPVQPTIWKWLLIHLITRFDLKSGSLLLLETELAYHQIEYLKISSKKGVHFIHFCIYSSLDMIHCYFLRYVEVNRRVLL